jgi:hypothetical protein
MFQMLEGPFADSYGGGSNLGLWIRRCPNRIWRLHNKGVRQCVAGAAAGLGGPGGGRRHLLTPAVGRARRWWPTQWCQ